MFEPRSATACRAIHQTEYETAFNGADRVILAPVGRPEIAEGERLDVGKIAAALRAAGRHADAALSVDAIVDAVAAGARPGDTVLLLSNGAFGGIYDKLRAALSQRAGAQITGARATSAHPASAHPASAQTTGAQTTGAQATSAQTTGAHPASAQVTGAHPVSAQPTSSQPAGAQSTEAT